MVKPGELVYRVVPESVAAEAVAAKAQLRSAEPGSRTPKKLVWDPNRLK